jgi:hypothetical protein
MKRDKMCYIWGRRKNIHYIERKKYKEKLIMHHGVFFQCFYAYNGGQSELEKSKYEYHLPSQGVLRESSEGIRGIGIFMLFLLFLNIFCDINKKNM